MLVDRHDDMGPKHLENERMARLADQHRTHRLFSQTPEVIRRDQPPGIPDGQMLPLRVNLIRIVDIGPDEVLEPGVRVEAGAVLADLDQPLPDGV